MRDQITILPPESSPTSRQPSAVKSAIVNRQSCPLDRPLPDRRDQRYHHPSSPTPNTRNSPPKSRVVTIGGSGVLARALVADGGGRSASTSNMATPSRTPGNGGQRGIRSRQPRKMSAIGRPTSAPKRMTSNDPPVENDPGNPETIAMARITARAPTPSRTAATTAGSRWARRMPAIRKAGAVSTSPPASARRPCRSRYRAFQ